MNDITFAQFIFAIGTILLIRAILINRKILKGYDLVGSFLTWLAMTFVLRQFIKWNDFMGLVAGSIQWLFWLFVMIFVGLEKFKKYRKAKNGNNKCGS